MPKSGFQRILALGYYETVDGGYEIQSDTVWVNVNTEDTIDSLASNSEYYSLTVGQIMPPEITAIYGTYEATISITDTLVHVLAANPTIVSYDSNTKHFKAEIVGEAQAIFNYKGKSTIIYFTVEAAPLVCTLSETDIRETQKTGSWDDNSLWPCGTQPTLVTPVLIKPNHIITVPINFQGQAFSIDLQGELKFETGSTILLKGN